MIELNEYALEKAREATYFGGLDAAIVAYLEALPGDGSERTRKASNDGPSAPPAMPCVPNSGFDSRDRGQIEQAAEIICKELFGPRTPFDGDSPLTPYGQSYGAAVALEEARLLKGAA